MEDTRPKCPACEGPVEATAMACLHCERALPSRGRAGAVIITLGALVLGAAAFAPWDTAGEIGHSAISTGFAGYMLIAVGALAGLPAALVLARRNQPAGFGPALLGAGAAAFTVLQVRNLESTIEKLTTHAVPLHLAYGHYVAGAGCALLIIGTVVMRRF